MFATTFDDPQQIYLGVTINAGTSSQDGFMMELARFIEKNPGLRTQAHGSNSAGAEGRAPNATPIRPPGAAPGPAPQRPPRLEEGDRSWFSDDSSDEDLPPPQPPRKLKERAGGLDFCRAPIGNSWNLIKGRKEDDVISGPGFGC